VIVANKMKTKSKDKIELSSTYFAIKETLSVFIDFGIIDEDFPHELKTAIK
jgi:hypothetical protein